MSKNIVIKGARSHNLKNIDVEIPRDKLTVFTGLSGSGKSSLAFDTIYAEGHRRFVESLSSYARMFLGQLDKPDVDLIEGLSPTISIDQKTTSKNPRSTVGTVTEIYDYLRLLYARIGVPHCPICGKEIRQQTIDQICEKIMSMPQGSRFLILAPMVRGQKGTHEKVLSDARRQGYSRVRIDGILHDLTESITLEKNIKHTIDIVVDRLVMKEDLRSRLSDSVENAINLSDGRVVICDLSVRGEEKNMEFSTKYACEEHNMSFGELEPRMFSFNNPYGACPECSGLGDLRIISEHKIIPDKTLSLKEGAIVCNGFKSIEEESWLGPLFNAAGADYGFDINTPICDYSPQAYQVLLYGTGAKLYRVRRYFGGDSKLQEVTFDGVIPTIRRRMGQMGEGYYDEFMEDSPCQKCKGRRLSDVVLAVTVGGLNIDEICRLSVRNMLTFIENLTFEASEYLIAREILKEIKARLSFLCSVGLDYLNLARKAGTLSGGEAQRIRLATQIGSGLVGVLYILDEPSIGLHQRDNDKLIATLKNLRDIGNKGR
jgi:excinuclease ABC subunit A